MNLTSNILTTLASRVMILAFALVSSIVLARYLGPEGRGIFALALLLPEWAKSFGLLGFEQANAVYAGLEKDKCRALVWHSIYLSIIVGGAISLLGIGYFAMGTPGTKIFNTGKLWMFIVPVMVIPAKFLADYWWSILRGMNRIVMLNIAEVATKIASVIAVCIFIVVFHMDVTGAIVADTLICIGTVAMIAIMLSKLDTFGYPTYDKELFWRSARFALPSHGGTVAAYMNYRIDELLVAALLPIDQLGYYVIAVGLVERIWIVPGSVANALLPHITNSRLRDPALPSIISRHVTIWVGCACLIVSIFAEYIIKLLYSASYIPSIAPFRWLLIGIFTLSIGKVLVAELLAREKAKYTLWASGIAALVNLFGNILLIPKYGITGAAIASSISYTILSIIIMYYYIIETDMSIMSLVPTWNDIKLYSGIIGKCNNKQ